jgi:uncharacterized protein
MKRVWGFALGALVAVGCEGSKSGGVAPSATVAASAAPAGSASAAPAGPSVEELGASVVKWIAAGENAKVRALFDDAMQKALPTDASVSEMWGALQAKAGKFKRFIEAKGSQQGGYAVVLATCDFEGSPMDLRLVFDKEKKLAGIFMVPTTNPAAFGPRPQTPKPPFPYQTREVTYDNEQDKSHLAGTLTVPKGEGPFPAVLLITGSGTQDRDETLFGHKPFAILADMLTNRGFAVLRVDDPGAGGSTGDVKNATIEAHARDAEAGVAFLKTQKEIDAKRIGLIGHSEGGIIAAVVGATSKDVAFIVSLAGTGLSGAEINPLQVGAILRADGKIKPDGITAIVEAQRKLMKVIAKDGDDKALEAATKEAFDAAAKLATSDEERAAIQKGVAGSMEALKSAWFKSFVKLDPAAYWSKVKAPVLALNGDKDTQVPADENLAAIKSALARAGNKDVETQKLAGLNHLFQPATTGLMDEYARIETTIDPKALDALGAWLAKRAAVK